MPAQITNPTRKSSASTPSEDRTAEICLTAARVICEKGYDAASMNDIAAACNLTKAGLYYYTSGKQDLLYRIIDYAMSLVEENARKCSEIDNPEERLQMIIHDHIMTVVDDGGSMAILSEEVNALSPEQRTEIIERKRRFLALARKTLHELKSIGRLNDLDPEIAALNMFTTILAIPRWYKPDRELPTNAIADQVSRFLHQALLKD